MTRPKLRTVPIGQMSQLVLGTTERSEARAELPDTVLGWESAGTGLRARRRGQREFVNEDNPPKDSRPGVAYWGPYRYGPPIEGTAA